MSTFDAWYRNFKLPSWGMPITQWLAKSAGLVVSIVGENVRVKFSDGTVTAYADQINKQIVVGSGFIDVDSNKRKNPNASLKEAATMVNGAIVHEAMHFKLSPALITDLLNNGISATNMNCTIANIVEDVYIEHAAITMYPTLSWMVFGAWDYMFADREDSWDGVSNNREDILNQMILWKMQHRQFNMRSDLERELFAVLYSVRGVSNLQERRDIVEKLINLVNSVKEEDDTADSNDSSADSNGSSAEDNGSSDEEESDDSQLDELMNSDVVFTTDGDVVDKGANGTAVAFSRKNNVYNVSGAEISAGNEIAQSVIIYDVVADAIVKKIEISEQWKRFGEIAKQRGAVRSVRGPAMSSGKRLTHPERALDDGKAFSNRSLQSSNGRVGRGSPQVILLIDCSNSMVNYRIFDKVCDAAASAVSGMAEGGIKCAVYGYTDTASSESVNIIRMKDFNDTAEVAMRRIATVKETFSGHNCTPDVPALQTVSRKFINDGSDKVLIVLTDGEPSIGFGSDSDGNLDDAIKNVAEIRSRGIKVFGLSLYPTANSAVQEIYGVENSILSTDPNAMEGFLNKFV